MINNHVILDTNVLVSALINPNGYPATVLELIRNGFFKLVFNEMIYREYRDVLLRKRFGFSVELVQEMLGFIEKQGVLLIAPAIELDFEDKSDEKFYELMLYTKAYLVTGNLKHFPSNVNIYSPRDFVENALKEVNSFSF